MRYICLLVLIIAGVLAQSQKEVDVMIKSFLFKSFIF